MRDRLRRYGSKLIIQSVPGHQDIPGNELADADAKEAAEMETEPYCPTWYHSADARIKSSRQDPPPSHERTRLAFSKAKDLELKNRSDQTLLAKIRSGHTTLFAAYRKRIGLTEDDTCPSCQEAPQTMVHWMRECSGTLVLRIEIFGPDDFRKLDSLTKHPLKAIAFAKKSLNAGRAHFKRKKRKKDGTYRISSNKPSGELNNFLDFLLFFP